MQKQMRGQRITMFLRTLIRRVHGIEALDKNLPFKTSPIAPKLIHKAIISCKIDGHRFRPGRQEDAHELLIHLFNAMREGELFAAGEIHIVLYSNKFHGLFHLPSFVLLFTTHDT